MAHQGTRKPQALDSHSGSKHGLRWFLRKDPGTSLFSGRQGWGCRCSRAL